jgi:hypothetical protein
MMLERLKRGEAARDVRLLAAQGMAPAPASELLSILVWLTRDEDEEVRATAARTLSYLPIEAIRQFLGGVVVTDEVRAYFEQAPASAPAEASAGDEQDADDPDIVSDDGATDRDGVVQKLASMTFPQRLKAAAKGSREVRAILIRDPSKVIAMAVLTSPKLTEPEVEAFARMGNVAQDVLRHIGSNRAWMKNYGIVVALSKNAKTPLGLSLNLMSRLNDRDLQGLSTDRNVPEPLRMAARKKVTAAASR